MKRKNSSISESIEDYADQDYKAASESYKRKVMQVFKEAPTIMEIDWTLTLVKQVPMPFKVPSICCQTCKKIVVVSNLKKVSKN